MNRVLEPELMDGEQQSVAYAGADFSASNQWFVDHLNADFPHHLRRIIDIGCGPADVLVRLAKARPDVRVMAIDGSPPMIRLAQDAVAAQGLEEQITIKLAHFPEPSLEEHSFDAFISKDLLHHLPDPSVLWEEVKRLGKPGAAVYVMDLHRPESTDEAQRLVEDAGGDDPEVLKRDFYNSLCAAFTSDEVMDQLANAGLALQVSRVSERHMLIKGLLP